MSDQIDNIRAIAHRQAVNAMASLGAITTSDQNRKTMTWLYGEFGNGWDASLAANEIPFVAAGPTAGLLARAGALAEWEVNNADSLNVDGWAGLALAWKRLTDECSAEYRDRVALVAEYGESL